MMHEHFKMSIVPCQIRIGHIEAIPKSKNLKTCMWKSCLLSKSHANRMLGPCPLSKSHIYRVLSIWSI